MLPDKRGGMEAFVCADVAQIQTISEVNTQYGYISNNINRKLYAVNGGNRFLCV